MHIARVETEDERRVLIIDDEGLLTIKKAIKNEYGIRIGSLSMIIFLIHRARLISKM